MVITVYDTSDYGLKLSDKADIESAEFPVYSVQKPRLLVVPRKMAVKSNFRYIGVRYIEVYLYKIFSGSKHPTNVDCYFENRSTGGSIQHVEANSRLRTET